MSNQVISDEGEVITDGDRRWEAIAQPAPPSGWHSGKVAGMVQARAAAVNHGPGKYVLAPFQAHVDDNGARWLQGDGGFVLTVGPDGKPLPVDARGQR